MRVAICYNEPGADAAGQDVLVQRDAIFNALGRLGHTPFCIGIDSDLPGLHAGLSAQSLDCVFNLVESIAGTDRLALVVPLLLEHQGLSYTGNDVSALLATSDKVRMKSRLAAKGLPTPRWRHHGAGDVPGAGRFILKPVFEHASVGVDDTSVIDVHSVRALDHAIAQRSAKLGMDIFAEVFIEGREFNLSVIEEADGSARVLPPAEIEFAGYPADKPRIVGYDAKWSQSSFEYNATPRRLRFGPEDAPLVSVLTRLAANAWSEFSLKGYARVDFRVNEKGEPWILEINANPCLSPDAGFVAAAAEGGLNFEMLVGQILAVSRPNAR